MKHKAHLLASRPLHFSQRAQHGYPWLFRSLLVPLLAMPLWGHSADDLSDRSLRTLKAMDLAIARARSQAIKNLEEELGRSMKAGNLEEAVQIQRLIDTQRDLLPKSEEDLGKGDLLRKLAGRRVVSGHSGDYWFFRADGTFDCPGWGGGGGSWEVKGDKVIATCKTGLVFNLTIQSPEVWTEDGKGNVWNLQR